MDGLRPADCKNPEHNLFPGGPCLTCMQALIGETMRLMTAAPKLSVGDEEALYMMSSEARTHVVQVSDRAFKIAVWAESVAIPALNKMKVDAECMTGNHIRQACDNALKELPK